ncbi:MAG: MBL fold metallo-hydrolase [Armatimonadota bacterium]|jgi:hydroxyacylglutathione hydrolase
MILEALVVGPLQSNCYIVGCPETEKGFIIDPGGDADVILEAVERLGIEIAYIFNTHEHVDHIAANRAVREATGARLVVHEAGRDEVEAPHAFWASMVGGVEPSQVDEAMADGDTFEVGTLTVEVVHTPGHSPGGVCLAVDGAVFTGDTLFAGSVGRTDLPGGNMATLVRSLRRLVQLFEPETAVYPGHRGPSTIGEERASNPYLQGV